MQISRRAFLLTAAAVACSRRAQSSPLQKAAEYLWAQQAEDGGFHSTTYGLLRSGQSLTPFVLDSLMAIPETFASKRMALDRAFAFIKKNTNANGTLGQMDETADYPNYATALAVTLLMRAGRHLDVGPMVAH